MVDAEYSNAYKEVLEILKYISKEEYAKIPKELIEVYQENANNNYEFIYNPNKTLSEQNVSKIAKGIIAILYRDYWATENEKKQIIEKQRQARIILEEQKKKNYKENAMFKKEIEIQCKNSDKQELAIVNKEKAHIGIWEFLKKIFIKRKRDIKNENKC